KYSDRRSSEQKLTVIFQAIKDANWTLGDFLYHTFSKSNTTNRSLTAYANKFLKGDSTYGVGAIVRLWMQSPDGAVSCSSDLASLLYNLDTPYDKIKPVR
ncbi:hypothetical protein PAXINDRAFT_52429, partial [Paxillus involutus ATCC 200175]